MPIPIQEDVLPLKPITQRLLTVFSFLVSLTGILGLILSFTNQAQFSTFLNGYTISPLFSWQTAICFIATGLVVQFILNRDSYASEPRWLGLISSLVLFIPGLI